MAIYDTMQLIKSDVATTCAGMAASMGSILLCGGAQGKRSILPHSKVMIHQPLGGVSGQASDILIEAKESKNVVKNFAGSFLLIVISLMIRYLLMPIEIIG